MERTLVIIKPDALQRELVGDITIRLERKGLKLIGMKMMQLESDFLKEHYAHLKDKPFYPAIEEFMKSTPVIIQCWEGVECVEVVRKLCGVTNAREAAPGTIRGDLAMSVQSNLIHASDSIETAKAEIPSFFKDEELFEYDKKNYDYIYAPDEK